MDKILDLRINAKAIRVTSCLKLSPNIFKDEMLLAELLEKTENHFKDDKNYFKSIVKEETNNLIIMFLEKDRIFDLVKNIIEKSGFKEIIMTLTDEDSNPVKKIKGLELPYKFKIDYYTKTITVIE